MFAKVCAGGLALAVVLGVAGCSADGPAPVTPTSTVEELAARPDIAATADALAGAVTADTVWPHLEALARIAQDNGGNRAAGTPGYDASVDYVAGLLRARGFEVSTPEFEYDQFTVDSVQVKVGERELEVAAMKYTPRTGANGITAAVVALPRERGGVPDDSPGCSAEDYVGVDVSGKIVLVDRGACPFSEKQKVAAAQGAAAVLVANNEDGLIEATLEAEEAPRIPAVLILREDGEALRANPGEVYYHVAATTRQHRSRNVLAQTATGSAGDVVMVGAHLDSVPEGPGVNDNGTGVGAVLEAALAMGPRPQVANAVRFAFWGAEELGLVGSAAYVEALGDAQKQDIALYLNFDMIGSPNAGYLAYDGDDSDQEGEGPGPEGSAGIERTFVDFLAGRGVPVEGTDFDGRSDYGPFIAVGIPAGGLFTGAEEEKSEGQAAAWGGTAGQALDPNYHTDKDTLDNVNREALDRNANAVGFAVGTYAQSIGGPNGVPARDAREAARNADGN